MITFLWRVGAAFLFCLELNFSKASMVFLNVCAFVFNDNSRVFFAISNVAPKRLIITVHAYTLLCSIIG